MNLMADDRADGGIRCGPAGRAARTRPADRHMLYEDVLALLLGTIFVAQGVHLYSKAALLIGGSAAARADIGSGVNHVLARQVLG